ncbi:MAG: PilZ domain-containing protein, partial [Nitrospirae bacterium]|nr:PilZ domain-containing protein [Nitrospirota bacterium]
MPDKDKDKRHFKRYRKQTGFRLKIAGKSFKAETIDYSFDGIGAFVEDSPPITQGSIVDVDMSVPDLHAKGRVVWAKKSTAGLMLGILRVDVPKKGRLEDFPLADLLIGLQRSGSTGVLRVDGNAGSKKIYINNGDIIFSTSEHRDDRLGEFLFRSR